MEQADTNEWLRNLQIKARTERIPLKANLELTSRCNLRCQHCYLGDQLEQHRKPSVKRVDLTLAETLSAACKVAGDGGPSDPGFPGDPSQELGS